MNHRSTPIGASSEGTEAAQLPPTGRWRPSADVDHPQYLLRLALDRHQRWRIRAARLAWTPSTSQPSRRQGTGDGTGPLRILQRRENHRRRQQRHRQDPRGPGLGLAACQRGMSVGFTTAASLVHELMEQERRLLNLQRQLSRLNLLIIDELGFVPLSRTGAELLFEVFASATADGDHQPTLRRVDRLRLGAPHRRAAGPAHPPRPHPTRELPPPRRENAAAQAPDDLDNP